MGRRTRQIVSRTFAPWDMHAEADETCIQYWNIWRWANDSSHYLEILSMPKFSDLLGGAARKGQAQAVEDPTFMQEFPSLFALMAVLVDDDGKPRQGCSLTIVCEDGVVKAGLNERNHELSLWTSAETLGGVFAALEEAIGEHPPRWRRKTWDGRKR